LTLTQTQRLVKDFAVIPNGNLLEGYRRFVMDFNSDGKSDILIIDNNKTYKILGFKTAKYRTLIELET
jgi:hypothetical protein